MKKEQSSLFQKRIKIFIVFIILIFTCLIGRLFYLQIIQSQKYQTLADDNRINIQLLLGNRGIIVDRKNKPIAINKKIYQAVFYKKDNPQYETALEQAKEILGLTSHTFKKIGRQIQNTPAHIPITLKQNLTWPEIAQLEINNLLLPGVRVEVSQKRFYPLEDAAASITGYVSAPKEKEAILDASLKLPGALTGKSGVEHFYENSLQGDTGQQEIEVDARGRPVRFLSTVPPLNGRTIKLTIDEALQKYVYEQLAQHKSAAAVVLDIHTGEILALVSYPSYDPNIFSTGITQDAWQSLLKDPQQPLINKTISGLYSPASLFKLIVALAALEQDPKNVHQQYNCPGHIEVGNHKFHCWKKHGHGPISFTEALAQSCDVYFYELAKKIGHKNIIAMANKVGFNRQLGIDLPNEKKGLVPTPQWKKVTKKEGWYLGDTILLSIGQGSLLSTPLQWAVLMAQIANGGKLITPYIVEHPTKDKQRIQHLGIKKEHLNTILHALTLTINRPGGTGYRSRIPIPEYKMGGKTATAQVRRISLKERREGIRRGDNIDWALRDNSLFMGFAPTHKPQFAAAVIIEHGGWGSVTAAPIGRNILQKTQEIFTPLSRERP
jgi:penicillin-binding protein 2